MDNRINKLLTELFRVQSGEITDNLSMKDTDIWDSLKHMELIVSIEQEFKIELTFDEIVGMQNVGEIKRIVYEKVSNQ
jgi:acyl carrier protein